MFDSEGLRERYKPRLGQPLTQKEFNAVYPIVAWGKTTKQSARLNGLTVTAVTKRVRSVAVKLGVHSMIDLVKAWEQGRI